MTCNVRSADILMSRIRDIIVGASGFARPGNWWFSKIPPLLAVVYLAILLQGIDIGRGVLLIVCFIVSVSCVAIYGHVINDAFDIAADQRAGKPNAMAALSTTGRSRSSCRSCARVSCRRWWLAIRRSRSCYWH